MYFIARNNKVYNYIAHTNPIHRYVATIAIVCAMFFIGVYVIYYPLVAHNVLMQAEYVMLEKKYEKINQLLKSNQDVTLLIEANKKTISDHAIPSNMQQEHCHKQMQFLLNSITQLKLSLTAYTSCTEKDKGWYIKNKAHFNLTGSLEKLMTFLETIKNSRRMITLSHLKLVRLDDNSFQMSFDAGLVTVKS